MVSFGLGFGWYELVELVCGKDQWVIVGVCYGDVQYLFDYYVVIVCIMYGMGCVIELCCDVGDYWYVFFIGVMFQFVELLIVVCEVQVGFKLF